jgi:hypothetical protein
MKPQPTLPISLTDIWLPSLHPNHRPSLLVRSRNALIAKIPVGSNLSPQTIRQLTTALETFHPASAGCQDLDSRELYYDSYRGCALLVFWIPESSTSVAQYAAAVDCSTKGVGILRIRSIETTGTPQISGSYQSVTPAQTQSRPPEAAGHKKRHGERLQLRKARQAISHIFPGLIKIVIDWHAGTIKSSFEGASIHKILKHRELYASVLGKFGFAAVNPDTEFKLGTWRVKTDGPKKKFYHVLTLFTQTRPEAKPAKIRVDFVPTWARKFVPKTEAEIDRELNEILTNRESLIKRLKIKTSTRQP